MKPINSMDDMKGGAVLERFSAALKTVLKNIIDPNTSATKARKVTLELTIKPSEDRTTANFELICKPTLAPPMSVKQSMVLSRNDAGDVVALQTGGGIGDQLPGQMDVEDVNQANGTNNVTPLVIGGRKSG